VRCRECGGVTRVVNTEHRFEETFRWLRCTACQQRTRTVERYYVRKPGPPRGKPRPGKKVKGEEHPNSVFTTQDIRNIRAKVADGTALRAVAAEYGTSDGYVSRIVRRLAWKHVTD